MNIPGVENKARKHATGKNLKQQHQQRRHISNQIPNFREGKKKLLWTLLLPSHNASEEGAFLRKCFKGRGVSLKEAKNGKNKSAQEKKTSGNTRVSSLRGNWANLIELAKKGTRLASGHVSAPAPPIQIKKRPITVGSGTERLKPRGGLRA